MLTNPGTVCVQHCTGIHSTHIAGGRKATWSFTWQGVFCRVYSITRVL